MLRQKPVLIAALAALLGALSATVALGAEERTGGAKAPAAQLERPDGVSAALQGGPADRRLRVRLILRQQPLLRAAQRPAVRKEIAAPVPARVRAEAARSPEKITPAEKRLARQNERRYERVVEELADEARAGKRDQLPVRAAVRRAGGEVLGGDPILNSVVAKLPQGALQGLADRDDVQAIEAAPRERALLEVAAPVIGAPTWWAAGHTGAKGSNDVVSSDAAVLRERPDATHPAFSGMMIDVPSVAPAPTTHGTHTAGVLASQDATYRGIAHGIDRLIGADTTPSTVGEDMAYAVGVDFNGVTGAPDPAETISTSFGSSPNNDNKENPEDLVAYLFGVGFAAAGGNAGPSNNTIENIGRNQLSVAALDDANTTSTADDVVWSLSSRGPSPGGRKKPDLIAPGVGITSPDGDWNDPPSNPDFTAVSGTSFSAPQVAGAMALLEGAGIGNPKAQRALLVNSARDWTGQTSWQTDVGWGVLDLVAAFADRAQFVADTVEQARFYRVNASSGDKATLAWELRGIWFNFPAGGSLAYAVTNLDLRQYRDSDLSEVTPPVDPGHGGGPDALDTNDTVEQVRAPAEGTQDLIYKVEVASTIENAAAEPFALATPGAIEELTAPGVEVLGVAHDAGGAVNCLAGSGDVVVTTQARNDSDDLAAETAELELQLPAGVSLVAGPATQTVSGGTLATETTSAEHSWTVRATSSGTKQLSVVGRGETMGETFTDTAQLSFSANCSPAEVLPTSTRTTPGGTVECDSEVTITTRLINSTLVDASQASVAIELPGNVELVSGAQSQQVAGGTLAIGATSSQHSWTVRQQTKGDATVTITGAGQSGGSSVSYAEEVGLSCSAVPTEIDGNKPKLRQGKLTAAGKILARPGGSRASAAGSPAGKVKTTWRRDSVSLRRKTVALDSRGRFKARQKVCRPGRWKVKARYLGSEEHVATKLKLGIARVKTRDLRC